MNDEIQIGELTTCGVSDDGRSIELRVIEVSGNELSLKMSFDQARSIVMTLPRLLNQALRIQTGDPNSRFVFPLGYWSVGRSEDAGSTILTLKTADGFGISFAIPFCALSNLSTKLIEEVKDSDMLERSQASGARERDHLH